MAQRSRSGPSDELPTAIPISTPNAATQLEYASPRSAKPPLDWAAAGRQVAFAVGACILVFGVAYQWSSSYDRTAPVAAGLGAFLLALTIPWPGRIGRRR